MKLKLYSVLFLVVAAVAAVFSSPVFAEVEGVYVNGINTTDDITAFPVETGEGGQGIVTVDGLDYYYCVPHQDQVDPDTGNVVLTAANYNCPYDASNTYQVVIINLSTPASGVLATYDSNASTVTTIDSISFSNPPGFGEPTPPPPVIPEHQFVVDPLDFSVNQISINGGSFGDYIYCRLISSNYTFANSTDSAACVGDPPSTSRYIQIPQSSINSGDLISGTLFIDGTPFFIVITVGEDIIDERNDSNEVAAGDIEIIPTCQDGNGDWGWALCPLMAGLVNFLDQLTFGDEDQSSGFLGSILDFDIVGDQESAIRDVWQGFRSIANILFVIVFLFVVYSAATGSVLNSYDVRKMLPRLAVAAVGVQLSFLFASFALSFFNDLGVGLSNLMLSPLPGDASNSSAVSSILARSPLNDSFGGFAVGVLFLFLGIVVAFGAILGIILMALVFIVRNIALIVMIAIAPVAVVMGVLPNTAGMFKKYLGLYLQFLMLFPIAALLFASGKLISYIWLSGTGGPDANLGEGDLGAVLIGTLALFAPYYLAPKLFSFAGSTINGVAQAINNSRESFGSRESVQRLKVNAQAGTLSRGGGRTSRGINFAARMASNPGAYLSPTRGARERARFRPRNVVRKLDEEDREAANNSLDTELAQQRNIHRQREVLREQALDLQDGALDRNTPGGRSRRTRTRRTEGRRMAALERMLITNDIVGLEAVQARAQSMADNGDTSELELFNRFVSRNAGQVESKAAHLIYPGGSEDVATLRADLLAGQHSNTLINVVGTLITEREIMVNRSITIRNEAATERANGNTARADQLEQRADQILVQADEPLTAMVETFRRDIQGNEIRSGRMTAEDQQLLVYVDEYMQGHLSPDGQQRLQAINRAANADGGRNDLLREQAGQRVDEQLWEENEGDRRRDQRRTVRTTNLP